MAGQDFDIMSHLNNMRFGQGGSGGGGGAQGGDGLANEKESPEIIVKGFDKAAGTAAKLLGANAPIPINFGEVSMFAGLETAQGSDFASKMINPFAGSFSLRGGALYNAIFAPLIKNKAITDLTSGVGGSVLDKPDFHAAAHDFGSRISGAMDIGGHGDFSALGGLSSPLPIDAPILPPSRGTESSQSIAA